MPGKPSMTKFEPPFHPELCEAATILLGAIVEGKTVLEVGGGRSTCFLSLRASHVWCIEHDPDWALVIDNSIPDNACPVTVQQVDRSQIADALGRHWDPFDVVIIDCWQHARRPSIVYGKDIVKPGGWMVIDDIHFPGLRETAEEHLRAWNSAIIRGFKIHPVSKNLVAATTAFYRRPAE